MTPAEAGKILGISPKADIEQVKKQYRRLMLQVHPDVSGPSKARYQYSAQEINLAYGVLKKRLTGSEGPSFSREGESSRKNSFHWDAPVNDQAWKERDVLHYAEDHEGNILGNFTIARGKYLWTTEEDFPLFLLSIYRCGQELLDEVDASLQRKEDSFLRRKIHPQLTYLLAQQFMDSTSLLKELAKKTATGEEEVYYLPAMLEISGSLANLKEGETLFPSRLKDHRLYLKSNAGQELGYLSFPDDRFYYIVIPLFEQRRILVKIKAAKKPASSRKGKTSRYHSLHLWLKLAPHAKKQPPENLNLQIRRLLEIYGRESQRP